MTAHTLSGEEGPETPLFDTPPADPVDLLRRWLADAVERGVREPMAATLATVDGRGRPSCRVLLVKGIHDGGLVFTTDSGSRKGRELATTPWAALNLYWRETLRQISVAGRVEPLPDDRCDALFADRPLAARAATVVSRQSAPLTDETALVEHARRLIDAGGPLVRPDGWRGYRLVPEEIEFWRGRSSRLHRRLRYDRDGPGWSFTRLQP